jgi:beta-phosphoglucomutase
MLKAVLFDLDGVVTDSAKYHYLAWKSLADELKIPFDERFNENLKGVSRMDSLELILENGGMQNAFTQHEKEMLADKKNEQYKLLIQNITFKDTLPGIPEFLKDLKDNEIKTAIASVSKNAFTIIDRLQLNDYFNHIMDASEVKNAKPFPDIFLAAAEKVGAAPCECVGIEDAKAGIESIKRAGMRAIGVGTPDQMTEADLRLNSTAELNLNLILNTFHDDFC